LYILSIGLISGLLIKLLSCVYI